MAVGAQTGSSSQLCATERLVVSTKDESMCSERFSGNTSASEK